MSEEPLETRFIQSDSSLTSLDLRPQLWTGIEQVAEKLGASWQEWVEQTLRQMPAGTINRANWLSSQVKKTFNDMLIQSVATDTVSEVEYGEYEAPENVPPHVLLKDVWIGPHETFEWIQRETGIKIVYKIDCKGFFLYAGYRDGVPLLVIENEREDGLSLVYQIQS